MTALDRDEVLYLIWAFPFLVTLVAILVSL